MKKLIAVICIFCVMIGAGVAEIIYTNSLFERIHVSLHTVGESMEEHPEQFDNHDTMDKMHAVMDEWEKNKKIVFMISNHAVMRSVDEKLVSLTKQIEINAYEDAQVSLDVVMNYIHELKSDNLPKIVNIF